MTFLPQVLEIARRAGEKILALYHQGTDLPITLKTDKTPVTEADLAANEIIRKGLARLTPDIPIISEEAALIPFNERQNWQRFWLVDPLDGTKEFIHRTDDFTVNIALIDKNKPIIGVIYAPVFDVLYYAAEGIGSFKIEGNQPAQSIHTLSMNSERALRVAISRRHFGKSAQHLVEIIPNCEIIRRGSSLKSCLIAEGKADFYPAFGPMSEWDIAAAQCIVEQAGGSVEDESGQPMRYNLHSSLLIPRLLVVGDSRYPWGQFFRHQE